MALRTDLRVETWSAQRSSGLSRRRFTAKDAEPRSGIRDLAAATALIANVSSVEAADAEDAQEAAVGADRDATAIVRESD